MKSNRPHKLLFVAISTILLGCQSAPPQAERISSSADPVEEIIRVEDQLKEAQNRQIDVLSPENYTDAQKSLAKAKKLHAAGKSDADVLQQVSFSKAWLNQAESKAILAELPLNEIRDARGGALRAGAPRLLETDWKRLDRNLTELTSAIEKGNMTPADKKGAKLVQEYRDLEVAAIEKSHLGIVDENIKSAKKEKAEKIAPQSYNLTLLKRENSLRIIRGNPRNTEAILKATEDATKESVHLINVVSKVKQGNSEDLVLLTEKQQQRISNLQRDQASVEKELNLSQRKLSRAERIQKDLEKKQYLANQADHLRQHFKATEAEVYTQDGKLKLRLKNLRFPSGQSTLGPKNQAFLQKVEDAIGDLPAKKILIQGHMDAREQAKRDEMLSTKRAVAVENFLTAKGKLKSSTLRVEGKGAQEPISNNKTPQGRSENRRIEMIIETE